MSFSINGLSMIVAKALGLATNAHASTIAKTKVAQNSICGHRSQCKKQSLVEGEG